MEECIFCKIVKGEIPSKKVYENEYVLAFEDITPKAKVHILVIPKIHIKDMNDINDNNIDYITNIMNSIKDIARITNIADTGYRIISNVGEDGGQEVPHLHFHILGGEKLNFVKA